MTTILPLTYLGNIDYYSHLIFDDCLIEQHASYAKQSYANRCRILTANGVQDLSIPIIKPNRDARSLVQIQISNQTDWQKAHWKTIESAYNTSPFFEYYKDELYKLYSTPYTSLLKWNQQLQKTILKELEYFSTNISYTDYYIIDTKNKSNDLREMIHPKKNNVSLQDVLERPYYQVFQNKFGFTPNLSIIDLLFNMGNETRIYLNELHKMKTQNIQHNI